jgi:hypothetical protein
VLSLKLDEGTGNINRDCNDLRMELSRNKAMLGIKVIYNAINRAVVMNRKHAFWDLIKTVNTSDKKIRSVLSFRKLFINFKLRRERKFFDLWFSRGMRPMAQVK